MSPVRIPEASATGTHSSHLVFVNGDHRPGTHNVQVLLSARQRLTMAVAAVALPLCAYLLPEAPASAAAVATPVVARTPPSITAAVASAGAQDVRSGIAVLDTETGQYYEAGDGEGQFPSESVVKVLIAARLLVNGQMSGSTEQLALKMITQSDDDAADSLWGVVGGPAVVAWAAQRYGITDLGSPPLTYGRWGNTKFTPRGITEFYAAVKQDPVVGPWLISAMHHMDPTASDGTNQTFGLPSTGLSGAFKQGWGGDDDAFDSEGLNSTGLLDGDRYAVAIFTQHIPYVPLSQLVPIIDALAAAVAPGGTVAPLVSTAATKSTPPTTSAPTTSAPTTSPLTTSAAPTTSAPSAPAVSSPAPSSATASSGSVSSAPPPSSTAPSVPGQAGTTATGTKHTRGINAAEASSLGVLGLAVIALLAFGERWRRHRSGG
jgi:hypothetical protein